MSGFLFRKVVRPSFILIFSVFMLVSCSSSGNDEASIDPPLPTVPVNIVAMAGNAEVVLSWDAVATADSYTVYWNTTGNVTTSDSSISAGSNTQITHSGLTNGTTYYYRVLATNIGGSSNLSVETTAIPVPPIPTVPINIVATAGNAEVVVSWDAVASADSYTVYWNTAGNVTTSDSSISAGSNTQITHSGLTNGTTYYYRVLATNIGGSSNLSVETTAIPVPPIPTVPINIVATAGNAEVVVSWDAVASADSYTVYWNTAGNVTTSDSSISAGSNTQITHSGLTNGTTYYYKVIASNITDVSPLSVEVLVKPVNQTLGHVWEWSHPKPQGNGLFDIAWNGALYVAVGAGGTILTSTDGYIWTRQISNVTNTLNSVTWTGTNFFVVGSNGTILSSVDGINWTDLSTVAPTLNGVVWMGSQYVVVGDGGFIMTSPDGVTWVTRVSGTTRSLTDVVSNGALLVITVDSSSTLDSTDVLLSNDGLLWFLQSGVVNSRVGLRSVIWTGAEFYATGNSAIIKSVDGVSWVVSQALGFRGNSIIQTDTHIVVVGGEGGNDTGHIISTQDGITWTDQTGFTYLHGAVWSGSDAVVVGEQGVTLTSVNSTNWLEVSESVTLKNLDAIEWTGSQYVAVGWEGTVLISPDALTWTLQSAGSYNLEGIDSSNSIIVAVGRPTNSFIFGAIVTSSDGISWSKVANISHPRLYDVVYTNSWFFAVGEDGAIVASPDGVLWTVTTPVTSNAIRGVLWTGTHYTAVGDGGTILTSLDGLTWGGQSSPTTNNLINIMKSGSFVVIQTSGSDFLTSQDESTWTLRTAPNNYVMYDMTWTGAQFVTAGSGGEVMTSLDGITWSLENSGTVYSLEGITSNGNSVVIVGQGGRILKSNK